MKKKPHIEFEFVSDTEGWETPPGYPSGIKQKILASLMHILVTYKDFLSYVLYCLDQGKFREYRISNYF